MNVHLFNADALPAPSLTLAVRLVDEGENEFPLTLVRRALFEGFL